MPCLPRPHNPFRPRILLRKGAKGTPLRGVGRVFCRAPNRCVPDQRFSCFRASVCEKSPFPLRSSSNSCKIAIRPTDPNRSAQLRVVGGNRLFITATNQTSGTTCCEDYDDTPELMELAVVREGRPTRRNRAWKFGLSRKPSMLGSR